MRTLSLSVRSASNASGQLNEFVIKLLAFIAVYDKRRAMHAGS
jgi:hypothetical protein